MGIVNLLMASLIYRLAHLLVNGVITGFSRLGGSTTSLFQMVEKIDNEIGRNERLPDFVRADRLKTDRLVAVDVGARDGLPKYFSEIADWIIPVMFEADVVEAQRLRIEFPQIEIFSTAVSDSPGFSELFITRKPGCSSLREPSGAMLSLMSTSGPLERFETEKIVTVECAPLSQILADAFSGIDLLKVDVQGTEFEVIQGLGSLRPFALNIETSTTEIYKSQRTLFELGSHLREKGYFPIQMMGYRDLPGTHLHGPSRAAQVHGDVIFVPDNSRRGREIIERDPLKWIVSLWALGHLRLALWQVEELKLALSKFQ